MTVQDLDPVRTMRVPDALWDAIKEWARDEQRSAGAQVRVLLEQALENRKREKAAGEKAGKR